MTFVHVFKASSQDSCPVLAIMSDVVAQLKEVMPSLQSVYYCQDNAGCYHCGTTVTCAQAVGKAHGVFVRRLDFSDPQGGQGACDRKAASIKSHMGIYHNAGNDIENPQHMKQAILSSGGVPATAVCVSGPPSLKRMAKVKIKGISLISNVAYEGEGIRLWRSWEAHFVEKPPSSPRATPSA